MAPKKKPEEEPTKEELVSPETKAVQEALGFYSKLCGFLLEGKDDDVKQILSEEAWESKSVETVKKAYEYLQSENSHGVGRPNKNACRSSDQEQAVQEVSNMVEILQKIENHPLVLMPDLKTDTDIKREIMQLGLSAPQEIIKKIAEIEEQTSILELERGAALPS
jgi:hypothetical protein